MSDPEFNVHRLAVEKAGLIKGNAIDIRMRRDGLQELCDIVVRDAVVIVEEAKESASGGLEQDVTLRGDALGAIVHKHENFHGPPASDLGFQTPYEGSGGFKPGGNGKKENAKLDFFGGNGHSQHSLEMIKLGIASTE